MTALGRVLPGPGQESVWDYPRPPRVEAAAERIRVVVDGLTVADSSAALRVLETSHPPVYYIPARDVREDLLEPTPTSTFCEFKGRASYVTLRIPETGRAIVDVAWVYRSPAPGFEAIRDHYAFYPGRVDEAWVGDERARAQAGGFYGGWITDRIVGPFKGEPGTRGW
jgi:uncharacterized protein (DUF427 family)